MACTDVQTIQAGNGSKTQFSFDFPYIFKSEIHVYFWNVTTKEYDEKLTTDGTYPWQVTDANPTIVEFTGTAPPSPTAPTDPGEPTVDNVKIRRITKLDDISALFNPGSAIRSDDLNKNFEQLRYAIQESNCVGIPDDVDDYLKTYYWDRFDNTLYAADAWVSNDTKIATTAAMDQRFQDEVNDTFTKAELATASQVMPDDDVAVPTTGALNDYINEVITNDIGTDGTGITVTDDGDGTITLGLADNTIDFSKVKDADIITYAEQNAGSPNPADTNIFTASAAARRFDTLVQSGTPAGSDWETGKTWLQNDTQLTLSVWNGSAWNGVASGGTFTNQPKVVYVDASSGSDSNDGHRISRPKLTIKAAVQQINADATYGAGSVVVVAPGVYQEAAPIDITKANVSIVGTALRGCIVHPTSATETNTMFRVNSGSFIQNITFTGMKAGTGTGNSADPALPSSQGWNVAFYPGATITKSPYVQNCTNFSDSEIDNDNINVISPAGGAGGDLDSAPTGGGLLVDGSVPATASPLRSIVCDSYTHVGLNGPGILVTNNGYLQATSSYAFFNKYHIKCLNGGQANLAASTTDFGTKALVADGKSPYAIFTSNVDGIAANNAITFNINAPVARTSTPLPWHGSATRPGGNMLVTVNSITYPVLSAVPNTDSEGNAGWTVTISRPNSTDKSINDGLNGALADDAAVEFFLRSMIASSGHTMEYVGSGTNYNALPENGGVPDETKQINESNNGKIWTATTDHNGTFSVGGFFKVDQRTGNITIEPSSYSVAATVSSDSTPKLGGNLDVNGNTITSLSNANVVIDPNGTGAVNVSASKIINVTDPTSAQDAATKAYVDAADLILTNSIAAIITDVVNDTTPQLGGELDAQTNKIVNLGTPTNATDAATKAYVDTGIAAIITDVVNDTTPQLGGNLDVQAFNINTSTTNGDINLVANGTGLVKVTENGLSAVPIVTQHDIGSGANQISLNGQLGDMAFQSSNNIGLSGDLNIMTHGIAYKDANAESDHTVRIIGPDTLTADATFKLPNADGTSGQFLKTDGSGALSFASSSDTTTKIAYVFDEKPSTTDGGTFTLGDWRTRDLGHEDDPNSIVSVSSTTFTLSVDGDYYIHFSAPAYDVSKHQARLANITDTEYAYGNVSSSNVTNPSHSLSQGHDFITISGSSKTFEVQHRSHATKANNGFGLAPGFGNVGVYTQVVIHKLT